MLLGRGDARGGPAAPGLGRLAIAAAADAKPWAAAFVPLLLALPRRQWLTALAAFTGGLAVAWLPFLLAEPKTLAVARFTIPNDPSSALRVLGVTAPQTPWWDRSAQLALGIAGGCLAVRRGRWQAVPLIAMSARILFDPGVYAYYTSGVLLGAIIVDLVLARWRLPWATIAGAALLYAARSTHALIPFNLHELGVLRLAFAVGAPVAVLAVPAWWLARRPGRHARNPADGSFSVLPPVPAADRHPSGPWPVDDSWAAASSRAAGEPGPHPQPRSVWAPRRTGTLLARRRMGPGSLVALGRGLAGGLLPVGGRLPGTGPLTAVRTPARGLLAGRGCLAAG